MTTPARAELGMYPFAGVRWAWDELWDSVSAQLEWAPSKLDHSGDVHRAWSDPNVIVNHVCGWPFVAHHRATMQLVGAFDIDLPAEPNVGPGRYRSVLLTSHRDRRLAELIGSRAVINSADSLSGSLSLLAATVGVGQPWPGSIVETAAHINSVDALLAGEADIACIDAWTLALATDERPILSESLVRVGYGPVIPTPAVTVRDPGLVDELAAAFQAAIADPLTADARRALHIAGWVDHDIGVYDETLALGRRPAE